MQKCKELSRLTKAPNLSSLLFRKQCPASSSAIQPLQETETVLDPGHPAVNLPRKHLPRFYSSVLNVTATPFGLLQPESFPCQPPFEVPIESWAERISRSLSDPTTRRLDGATLAPVHLPKFQKRGRLSISLVTVAGKKATSKKKVVRLRIINKVKNALYLAVIRAAEVEDGKLVLDKVLPRQDLICWTYTVFPSLEIYRMPFSELVPVVLQALRSIHKKAVELENSWAQKSFAQGYNSSRNMTERFSAPSKSMSTRPTEDMTSYERRNRILLDAEMNDLAARSSLPFDEWSSRGSSRSSGIISSSSQAAFQIDSEPWAPQADIRSEVPQYPREGTSSVAEGLAQLLARLGSTSSRKHQNGSKKASKENLESYDHDSVGRHSTDTQSAASKNLLDIRRPPASSVTASTKDKMFSNRPVVGTIPQVKEKFRFKDSVSQRDLQKRERKKSTPWIKKEPGISEPQSSLHRGEQDNYTLGHRPHKDRSK
ncbi:hypothetical protein DFJ43DRAFT_1202039 [Lentinula guzmanii]|uniref:Uncharacterized protein n=1 Tax=Lentinula guzmanii TaxID=2804957 RepID=A0AA38JHB9_9AGAR|nr:hypothetical protein DFJ43DRAFT_1202039 [Lentinula guzmanii]